MIRMPFASRFEIELGRRLRGQMTDAEVRLWMRLRGKQVGGHRFRRQVPMGSYIVDFACLKARLIVEVDGSQHLASKGDEERTAWLESRGFRVLRFWDNDVLQRTDDVLEAIHVALQQAPTLPSPTGGGNNRGGK
jgi:primosomal protein N' (replication factor Y)